MISRRRFLQSSAALALLPLVPRVATSATVRVRQSWEVFRAGPGFVSLCNAISAMRANKDSTDPNAWTYWSETHRQFCPHGKPYFLAWHRGFLYRFEGRLRQVSGDPNLTLPYWNYYDTPSVPPEFLEPTSSLYRGDRTGTDVSGGLSLDAFADTVTYFQRGKADAFEAIIEPRPHNHVHNLIGGAMSSILTSPRDPLFWVHHANVDRLWAAWLAAGGGRHQPAASNAYWSGDFSYGAAIKSVPRVWTTSTTSYLGYQYDNQTMPTSLPPPPPSSSALALAPATLGGASPDGRPLRPATTGRTALGASQPLALDERSISIEVPLTSQDASRVRSLMLRPSVDEPAAASPLRVVLDGVELTGLGARGGYLYDVFVNLPEAGQAGAPASAYRIGTIGAFEVSVAQMQAAMNAGGMHGMDAMAGMPSGGAGQGARLVFPLTDALKRLWPAGLDRMTVSFVRVDGRKQPIKGQVIRVKAFSVQADPAS